MLSIVERAGRRRGGGEKWAFQEGGGGAEDRTMGVWKMGLELAHLPDIREQPLTASFWMAQI